MCYGKREQSRISEESKGRRRAIWSPEEIRHKLPESSSRGVARDVLNSPAASGDNTGEMFPRRLLGDSGPGAFIRVWLPRHGLCNTYANPEGEQALSIAQHASHCSSNSLGAVSEPLFSGDGENSRNPGSETPAKGLLRTVVLLCYLFCDRATWLTTPHFPQEGP